MSALKKISRIGTINASSPGEVSLGRAWEKLRGATSQKRRELTAGVDGVTVNNFTLNQKDYIKEISRQIQNKTYKFGKLKVHLIPKSKDKDRVICVPSVRDRIVQKSLLLYLEKQCPLYSKGNGISYSSEGVHKAVLNGERYRSSYPYIYKTDVSSFFDRIDRELLAQQIKAKINYPSLHPLLIAASKCEIENCRPDKARRIKKAGIQIHRGIRQGMPLSPFFANLFLTDFDTKILVEGRRLDFKVIRYVDDLVFFAKDESTCHTIHEICKRELNPIGLTIPEFGDGDKTQIYKPNEDAEFLGVALSHIRKTVYEVIIPEDQYDKIKGRILQLSDLNYLDENGITLTHVLTKFKSMNSGYFQAYKMCSKRVQDELLNKTNQWYKQAKKQLFKKLGINVHTLTNKEKVFLELTER